MPSRRLRVRRGRSRTIAVFVAASFGAATLATAAPPPATWSGDLAIQRCESEELILPAQTEVAIEATLLVRTDGAIGSAVLVSPDGFALTAAHVVGDARAVQVIFASGVEREATVLRVDEYQDAALVHLQLDEPTPCLVPASSRPGLGSDVFVLGSPAGEELSFSVAKGIVGGHRELAGRRFIQLDASVNPGNSGGPVLDDHGRLLGVASWKVTDVAMEGLAFAVPVETALTTLDVVLADTTDEAFRSRGGRRPAKVNAKPEPVATVDAPAPAAAPYVRSEEDRKYARRMDARQKLIGAGAGGIALGGVLVLSTAIPYFVQDETTKARWTTMLAFNTAGWVALGIGAALLGSGLLIRKKRKSKVTAGRFGPRAQMEGWMGGRF